MTDWLKETDQPEDEDMTIEMRLDILEASLKALRYSLLELDHTMKDLYDWAKRTDNDIIGMNRNANH